MDIQLDWLVLLTFAIALVTAIFSGIGGGGGGFVTTPYFLAIGLTPQETVATGKMGGLGVSVGSALAFRGKGLVKKKYLGFFLAITIACAFVAAWLMPRLDAAILQQIIGWTLVILSPTVLIKRSALQTGDRPKRWVIVGFVLYVIISFGQTMMGAGVGTLLVLVLMFLFGMSALEANATKRVVQISQALILFVLLLAQGLVVVAHGFAMMVGAWIGGFIGSRFALKKGEQFVKIALAVTMFVSGSAVLVVI